jgi:transcriptional regulator with XRE-family HTH domain
MDLRVYLRVIRRFWPLVVAGVVLAAVLSFVSVFHVDLGKSPHVTFRQHETWKGTETLYLTQHGFPWGRSVYPYTVQGTARQPVATTPYADPNRFNALAIFYAELASSDAVRTRLAKTGGLDGSYTASPVANNVGGGQIAAQSITQIVPLVRIDGFAAKPAQALDLARRVSRAFRAYLAQSQQAAAIPRNQRVIVQVLSSPREATLAKGRRLTVPIVIFLVILIGTLILAFVLENLRPREQTASGQQSPGGEHVPDAGGRVTGEPAAVAATNGDGLDPAALLVAGRASTLGARLRETRLRRGLDLRDIEARIDVETKYLRALESERFDLLPSRKRAREALRTYADHLDLDASHCLDEFDSAVAVGGGDGRWGGKPRSLFLPSLLVAVTLGSALLLAKGSLSTQATASSNASAEHGSTAHTIAARTWNRHLHARTGLARLTIAATRGASWVSVRAGSARGRVLAEQTLERGQTLRFHAERLWIRLGAATNLDVTVNGSRPATSVYGTFDAVVTEAGLEKVPFNQ